MQHKKTNDAQEEIDALLHRAELWRSYRPIDAALVSDHMEIDLDTHDSRADYDAETATIRLFQPKREEPVRVPSVEYEELRVVWREMVGTATMLCTSALRVIRHTLARLAEIVSAYACAFEKRTSRPFAFVGGEIPSGESPQTFDAPPVRMVLEHNERVLPRATSEVNDTELPFLQSSVPSVSEGTVALYEGGVPTRTPVVAKEVMREVSQDIHHDTSERGGGEGDSHSYQPFTRPIARSGPEVYARFRASNPEHPVVHAVSTPLVRVPERLPYTEDHAVTMPIADTDDVGETLPLTRSDVAISALKERDQRPRVWRDAWRIVFSELFGGLTQK